MRKQEKGCKLSRRHRGIFAADDNNADVSKAEIILLDNRKNDYHGKLEKYKKTFSICEVHGMVTVLLNY